jgi:hypothetical protein
MTNEIQITGTPADTACSAGKWIFTGLLVCIAIALMFKI